MCSTNCHHRPRATYFVIKRACATNLRRRSNDVFLGHYGLALAGSRAFRPLRYEQWLGSAERAGIAWSALGIWLFAPWAWWVDKHRMPITASTSRSISSTVV